MELVKIGAHRGGAAPAERKVEVQTALILVLVDGEEYRVLRADATEVELECADPMPDTLALTLTVFDVHQWAYVDFPFAAARVVERRPLEFSEISRVELGPSADPALGARLQECLDEIAVLWGAAPRRPGPQGTAPLRDRGRVLPEYPPKKSHSYETYDEQRRAWFAPRPSAEANATFAALAGRVERAFNACTPQSYGLVLAHGCTETARRMLDEVGLADHGLFSQGFQRFYLGNEFCPHLFPSTEQLLQLMDAAHRESLAVTVNGPYLIEHTVEGAIEVLREVEQWSRTRAAPVEMVVNDWGVIDLMKTHGPSLRPVLGKLLNKRKKDPRVKWYWGHEKHAEDLEKTNLNAPWFREFLAGLGVDRYEFEAGPMRAAVPPAERSGHSLHYPFYETNSSVFCMLYAEVTEFYSGRQRMVQSCPRYCTDFNYIYPDHLRLVGKGNTIFGFDDEILVSENSLGKYLDQGVDRLVFSPDC